MAAPLGPPGLPAPAAAAPAPAAAPAAPAQLQQPQVFQPHTRRGARRNVRGDFGNEQQPGQGNYPGASTHRVLQNAWEQLATTQPCNPAAPNVMPGLPADVLNAPADEQCLLAVKHTVEQASQRVQRNDRRSIRLPRVGDQNPIASGELANFPADQSRPYWAKKCLDRARQMYTSAIAKLRRVVELAGEQVQDNPQFIVSMALVYSTIGVDSQIPRQNKQSALWLVYMAYRLIRDTEMNPRAPMIADPAGGAAPVANPLRIQEDRDYIAVMGTRRLEPNRLGLGPFEAAGAPRLTGPARPKQLYEVVTSADARNGGAAGSSADEVPDMAQCLENVHLNFPPPTVPQPPPGAQDAAAAQQSPQPRLESWALLGQAYPPGLSPFPQMPANYTPIFFPTGHSANNEVPARPPYVQGPLQPLVGHPDPETTAYWDARTACAMLKTKERRLEEIALRAGMRDAAEAEQRMRMQHPERPLPAAVDQLPLRYWPGGPVAVSAAAPMQLPPAAEDARVALLPPTYTKAPGPARAARIDPVAAYVRRPGNAPPRTSLVRPQVPVERRRVPTGSVYPYGAPPSAEPVDVQPDEMVLLPETRRAAMLQHALFQLDAPRTQWQVQRGQAGLLTEEPSDFPQARWGDAKPHAGLRRRQLDGRMDPAHRGWAAYGNPFLLAQPVPPRIPQTPAQRERAWQVRTLQQGAGAAAGVAGRTRGRGAAAAAGDQPPHVRADAVPIGPLLVDPLYGRDVDHVPSRAYAQEMQRRLADPATPQIDKPRWLWFIRTDQVAVDGTNTWGLDYMWPGIMEMV